MTLMAIALVIVWAMVLGISPGLTLIVAALAVMLLNAMPKDGSTKVTDHVGRKA